MEIVFREGWALLVPIAIMRELGLREFQDIDQDMLAEIVRRRYDLIRREAIT
jgi:hypothetical protein